MPSAELIAQLFKTMCLIRAFEEKAGEALEQGLARGSVHQYVGQEAVATGICAHLRQQDYIASYHRGHGHAIAKGVDITSMAKELLGRAGGTCAGKGGSMHIADFSKGMLGANGVVADGVTLAIGAAHSVKLLKQDRVVVAFFGDGALNRGPLFEAFNWASVYELPVLFVCEDNQYSVTQRTKEVTAGPGGLARASAFGIPTMEVNGNDVFAVLDIAGRAIEQIKKDHRPMYLHAHTHRWLGHLAYDKGLYRDPKEVASWKKQDCIQLAAQSLLKAGLTVQTVEELRAQANMEVELAMKSAEAAPFPDLHEAYTDISDAHDRSEKY